MNGLVGDCDWDPFGNGGVRIAILAKIITEFVQKKKTDALDIFLYVS